MIRAIFVVWAMCLWLGIGGCAGLWAQAPKDQLVVRSGNMMGAATVRNGVLEAALVRGDSALLRWTGTDTLRADSCLELSPLRGFWRVRARGLCSQALIYTTQRRVVARLDVLPKRRVGVSLGLWGDSSDYVDSLWRQDLSKELDLLLGPLGIEFSLDTTMRRTSPPRDFGQKMSDPVAVWKPEDTRHTNPELRAWQEQADAWESRPNSDFRAILIASAVRIQWRPLWAQGDSLRLQGGISLPWRDPQGNAIGYVGEDSLGNRESFEVLGYPKLGVMRLRQRDTTASALDASRFRKVYRAEEEGLVFALPRNPTQTPVIVMPHKSGPLDARRVARALVREWAAQVGIPMDGGPENALSPLPHEQRERLVWTAKQWRAVHQRW